MVLNDWQRGKLPYFIPPPGCNLQPKPDSHSDNETTCTNDTSVTTADSLFESVKFDKDDDEEEDNALMRPPPSLPDNLQELVKQDLRKIVQSVEYFDEEKYEGGRKRKKKVTEKEAQSKKVTEKEAQLKKAIENEAQSAAAVSTAEEADDVSAETSDTEEAPTAAAVEAVPKKQE